MSFNRTIVPSEGGTSGELFAEFLRVDSEDELELTEMVSLLYDRLYRLGMVRHTDGTRATRKRKRDRDASKRRKGKAHKAKPRKAKTRNTRKAKPNRRRVRAR